ncbi:hypothetical protein H8957_000568 [Semnopithecus entellus]
MSDLDLPSLADIMNTSAAGLYPKKGRTSCLAFLGKGLSLGHVPTDHRRKRWPPSSQPQRSPDLLDGFWRASQWAQHSPPDAAWTQLPHCHRYGLVLALPGARRDAMPGGMSTLSQDKAVLQCLPHFSINLGVQPSALAGRRGDASCSSSGCSADPTACPNPGAPGGPNAIDALQGEQLGLFLRTKMGRDPKDIHGLTPALCGSCLAGLPSSHSPQFSCSAAPLKMRP